LRISNGFSATYVASRTDGERSSIIFDHGSRLFEFCSMQAVSISYPKPSGLGMVSIFRAQRERSSPGMTKMRLADSGRAERNTGRLGVGLAPAGFCIGAAIRTAKHESSCIANSNSVSVGTC
jgi:hypothetical protein